jgi:hypothetical protein
MHNASQFWFIIIVNIQFRYLAYINVEQTYASTDLTALFLHMLQGWKEVVLRQLLLVLKLSTKQTSSAFKSVMLHQTVH